MLQAPSPTATLLLPLRSFACSSRLRSHHGLPFCKVITGMPLGAACCLLHPASLLPWRGDENYANGLLTVSFHTAYCLSASRASLECTPTHMHHGWVAAMAAPPAPPPIPSAAYACYPAHARDDPDGCVTFLQGRPEGLAQPYSSRNGNTCAGWKMPPHISSTLSHTQRFLPHSPPSHSLEAQALLDAISLCWLLCCHPHRQHKQAGRAPTELPAVPAMPPW